MARLLSDQVEVSADVMISVVNLQELKRQKQSSGLWPRPKPASVKPISSFTVSSLLLYTFIFSFVDVSRVCLTAGFALFDTGTQLYLSKTPFVTRHV